MSRVLAVTIIGFISGMVGTGLGGVAIFFLNRPSKRFMSILLGFTGGIMLAVVCFDLIPQAFGLGGMIIGLLGIILGALGVMVIDSCVLSGFHDIKGDRNASFIKSGILLGLGIAIHNFPEGLAIGSGFAAANYMGMRLAIIIAIHDMPEGIAMAVPLKIGGYNRQRILVYTILAGIPTGIGAFVGEVLGSISNIFISLCMGFAAGAMLFITCGELIPNTQSIHKGKVSTMGIILGLLCGLYIIKTI